MSELPDKKPLLPPEPGTPDLLKPGTMGPAPASTRQRKRKRRKDPRRRAPTGRAAKPQPKLTPVHMEQLRNALRSAWTPYAARKHFAPLWGVSEEIVRQGTDQILAELTEARESVPPERRAANVLEGLWSHVRYLYDQYEGSGGGEDFRGNPIGPDARLLSGVPATLAQIARIEAVGAPVKVEHGGEISHALTTGDMPPDKIKARIEELQAKYGFGGTPKK